MTREQAKREIDNIDFYLQHHTDDYSERSHDAMMMAIQALSQEPLENIREEIASHIGGCGFLNDGLDVALRIIDKHCPSCGAKMESEDKE